MRSPSARRARRRGAALGLSLLLLTACAAPAPPLPPLQPAPRALDTFTERDAAMSCAEIAGERTAVAADLDLTPEQRLARDDTLRELARAKGCAAGSAE